MTCNVVCVDKCCQGTSRAQAGVHDRRLVYKANLIRRLGSAAARQTPVEVAMRARDGKTEALPLHDSRRMTSMKTGHANATSDADHESSTPWSEWLRMTRYYRVGTQTGAIPLISNNTEGQRWITRPRQSDCDSCCGYIGLEI